MARLDNAPRWTRPRIGATAALVALLAATAAGCGDGETAASGTSKASEHLEVTVDVSNLDEWCGTVREVGEILDGNSLDAPLEELQPIHADVVALSDLLIAGIEVIDAGHRDDVLTVIEAQQMLSQMIVDATDATAMHMEIDEVTTSQPFVVAEGTYEWVGTTCGLDESGSDGADATSDEPLVPVASHGDVSVIVDQSPTVSDVGALGFLAARSDVELLAVTMPATGEADCSPGAVTTRAVLDAAGLADVPIGCGGEPLDGTNEWPAAWSGSADALAGILASGADEPTLHDAESVLLETLASADTPVTIVVLGPLTNIAAVLRTDPSLASRIEQIVVMGGAVSVAGNVQPDLTAEWNLHAHPAAAQAVIESGVPIVLVPLDATDEVPLTSDYVAAVASIDNELAGVETAALGSLGSLDGMFMWDELAAVLAVQPEVATWSERSIVVEDDGSTVESPEGMVVQVAVGADAASARSIVLDALDQSVG
jgi:inosine-uridine nucleoside N-ribohydrolase